MEDIPVNLPSTSSRKRDSSVFTDICNICQMKIEGKKSQILHRWNHDEKLTYQAKCCSLQFDDFTLLQAHEKKHYVEMSSTYKLLRERLERQNLRQKKRPRLSPINCPTLQSVLETSHPVHPSRSVTPPPPILEICAPMSTIIARNPLLSMSLAAPIIPSRSPSLTRPPVTIAPRPPPPVLSNNNTKPLNNQVSVIKPINKAVPPPIENVNVSYPPTEKVKIQAPFEKVKIQAPIEKVKIQSSIEKVKIQSPIEMIKIQSSIEKVKIQSPIEKVRTKSSIENVGYPPTEKVKIQVPIQMIKIQSSIENGNYPSSMNKVNVPPPPPYYGTRHEVMNSSSNYNYYAQPQQQQYPASYGDCKINCSEYIQRQGTWPVSHTKRAYQQEIAWSQEAEKYYQGGSTNFGTIKQQQPPQNHQNITNNTWPQQQNLRVGAIMQSSSSYSNKIFYI